jgi:hypothetical protein
MTDHDEDNSPGTMRKIARGCTMFVVGLFVFAVLVFGVCAIVIS